MESEYNWGTSHIFRDLDNERQSNHTQCIFGENCKNRIPLPGRAGLGTTFFNIVSLLSFLTVPLLHRESLNRAEGQPWVILLSICTQHFTVISSLSAARHLEPFSVCMIMILFYKSLEINYIYLIPQLGAPQTSFPKRSPGSYSHMLWHLVCRPPSPRPLTT